LVERETVRLKRVAEVPVAAAGQLDLVDRIAREDRDVVCHDVSPPERAGPS